MLACVSKLFLKQKPRKRIRKYSLLLETDVSRISFVEVVVESQEKVEESDISMIILRTIMKI